MCVTGRVTRMLQGSYWLVKHIKHVASMLRGCYEETAPVNLSLTLQTNAQTTSELQRFLVFSFFSWMFLFLVQRSRFCCLPASITLCISYLWKRLTLNPVAPIVPVAPVGPRSPWAPGIPCRPLSPRGPATPIAPSGPMPPGFPRGPGGPIGPVNPTTTQTNS